MPKKPDPDHEEKQARNRASTSSDTSGPRDGSKAEAVQNELANNSFIAIGKITDVFSGLYDLQVSLGGSGTVSGVYLPAMVHELTGGGGFSMPQIGDRVLGVKFNHGPNPFYVLGTFPPEGAEGGMGAWVVGAEVDCFTEPEELSGIDGDPVGVKNRNSHRILSFSRVFRYFKRAKRTVKKFSVI